MSSSYLLSWRGGLLAWLLLASLITRAQAYINLGLEPRANHGQPLALWAQTVPPGGRVVFDSTVFRQGRGSLRLELPTAAEPRAAYISTSLVPLDSTRGQLVTVSVWVRTQGWRGTIRLNASNTATTIAGLTSQSAFAIDSLPNADWHRLALQLPVRAVAYSFDITMQLRGSGRVWLDDMQLSVRGRPLPELPVPATAALLLPAAEVLTTNWDFERRLPRLGGAYSPGATVTLDSASPQHGRRYLRLVPASAPGQRAPAAYLGALRLIPNQGGQRLRVMGYWRRLISGPNMGPAPSFSYRLLSFIPRPDGGTWKADTLGTTSNLPTPGAQWTSFAFEVPLQGLFSRSTDPAHLGALALSVVLPTPGALELDNLTFALDGKPYVPTGPPTPPPPTAAEQAWLRTVLKPLRLATPATAGSDLAALGTLLGPARLVGLGEVTHGSKEVFSLNARISQYLIEQKGFSGLLLEASPAGCAALNNYLRTGQGDPARLLAALDGWHTPAVLALVRSLRTYQQAHPSTPLLVAGIEVRQPEQALAYLGQLVEAKDDFAQPRLRQLAQLLIDYRHPAAEELDVRQRPDQPRDSLLAPLRRLLGELASGFDTRAKLGQPTSLQLLARQRYYLRLVEQGATWRRLDLGSAENYRQACLAENAHYLSQQYGGKLLLWANNRSVAKFIAPEERPMGEWLRATLGPAYLALGMLLGQGSFAAQELTGRWAPASLAAVRPGSYEAWLRTGPAMSWLGLSKLELTEDNAWLFQSQLLHDIGYADAHNQYMLHSLRGEFDAVLFIRDSTPVPQLARP
ncbi:erythromycin esterase family protein [Hymenobacter setariae]|uniref:Erythromycin esterase family protein n=1 Tax=Hymenobacter setariae TaxID=2594794 RepID=A0A558BXG7_9BACT|nr:erythromycin esterase family protein [Hymenobacter setariae]TVT41210.1 erythromycin esterase family protein [Hymenobacter setariae]